MNDKIIWAFGLVAMMAWTASGLVHSCTAGPKDREWHQCVSTCGSQATWDTRDGFCLCEGEWKVVE